MPTFRAAWAAAVTGPTGRFARGGRDFSTALTDPVTGPVLAAALGALAHRVDAALGRPDPFDVLDVGAGTGTFLAALAAAPTTPARWRLTGVEIAPRPALDPRIGWAAAVPATKAGFLLAHEWLDDVPCEVLSDGRVRHADDSPGPEPDGADRAWLDRWWPGWRQGHAECGRARDEAWAGAVGRLGRGLALAVDYGHTTAGRRPTLVSYADGRRRPPSPDGAADLTAHVALDALAAAVPGSTRTDQRTALPALLPPRPTDARQALAHDNAVAVLRDPAGYGGYGWVGVARGIASPWAKA